jgi:hypothetical protein
VSSLSLSTACWLKSTLSLLEDVIYPAQEFSGCSSLSVISFPPLPFHLGLSLMFCLRSEGRIAPVTCVYAYAAGLGGKLRAVASWSSHLSTLFELR